MSAQPKPKSNSFQPVRYEPAFEQPPEDENDTIKGLLDSMRQIRETTYSHSGHASRSVHIKSHGLLKGELQVLDNLPEFLAQGIFTHPGAYPALMRLSTSPGDMLPDKVSTPRGCALKIVGVRGERLSGSENAVTQDFLLVNGFASFLVDTPKQFLARLKLLAPTTDKMESVKVAVSAVMRGVEKALETVGSTSGGIRNMGGEPEKHILGETFFSQVPLLYGPYMAKLSLVPVSEELKALTNKPVPADKDAYAIRNSVIDYFGSHEAVWELRAQLCTDIDKMPIEKASVEWPEKLSPYVTVARLSVKPQLAWSEARAEAVEDSMLFSPWHGLKDHRPIGGVQRVRKIVYDMSAKFRSERNKKPVQEPAELDSLPE